MISDPLILIVDDEPINLQVFTILLTNEGYKTIQAVNGIEAIEQASNYNPDVILLDIMMPIMDGYVALEKLKLNPLTKNIPVIILTALNDRNAKIKSLEIGASDFLTKPIDNLEVITRVKNLLRVKEYNDFLQNYNVILEDKVKEKTAELKKSYIETILTLCKAAEFKDEDTGLHVQRISFYCKFIASELGLGNSFSDMIFYASPMHDIGKIGIPDFILKKQAPLSKEEWEIMRTHSEIGYSVLKNNPSPFTKMGSEIALTHHERWDGTGYPKGLKGEEIPLSGRIMNICDQYDALRSKRSYKPAFSHDKTIEIILNGDGRSLPTHFDPDILNIFPKVCKDFNDIYESNKDG